MILGTDVLTVGKPAGVLTLGPLALMVAAVRESVEQVDVSARASAAHRPVAIVLDERACALEPSLWVECHRSCRTFSNRVHQPSSFPGSMGLPMRTRARGG